MTAFGESARLLDGKERRREKKDLKWRLCEASAIIAKGISVASYPTKGFHVNFGKKLVISLLFLC
jgi:hypothetical protein